MYKWIARHARCPSYSYCGGLKLDGSDSPTHFVSWVFQYMPLGELISRTPKKHAWVVWRQSIKTTSERDEHEHTRNISSPPQLPYLAQWLLARFVSSSALVVSMLGTTPRTIGSYLCDGKLIEHDHLFTLGGASGGRQALPHSTASKLM